MYEENINKPKGRTIKGSSTFDKNSIHSKYGDYGEEIARDYFKNTNITMYSPVHELAHGIDNFATNLELDVFALEIKTKARMKYYPCTGFNLNHWEKYKIIQKKLPVHFVFVDYEQGCVMAASMKKLEKNIYEDDRLPDYLILFKLEAFKVLRTLTPEEITKLKSLEQNSY